MRVGVDVRCLMEGRRTGVEEYTLGILRALAARAPDDTFLLFANSRSPMHLPAFDAPNIEVRTFAYPNTLFNLALKTARRPRLDRLLGGVDVFFVPAFRLAPLSAGCPLVLTVHDLSYVRHPECFSRERQLWHRLMEPARLARGATRLLAVSGATARDVGVLYGVPPERVTVIPSGIAPDMERLPDGHPRLRAVRERYRLPERFLLFLGTLEPRKNLPGLLDAYAVVREAGLPHALVLAGIRGWLDASWNLRLQTHPYAADIHLTGFIEDAEKPAVYQRADLFVYPSFYEGFGFPPLEALACGVPVVTSSNSAIPEVVGPWAALVDPYHTEELAAVLVERLRDLPAVPSAVSAEIRQRYRWDEAARKTIAVLRSAATES